MIPATHIIGLTALEQGVLFGTAVSSERQQAVLATVAGRWHAIKAGGKLVARTVRGAGIGIYDTGHSFIHDELAGDGQFIFLEHPSRYHQQHAGVWGWQFDAEQLVALGAVVCAGDLGPVYEQTNSRPALHICPLHRGR